MTKASVCTIGDEILIGQIVDTNSSHISRALNSLGIRVGKMVSIADDAAQIKDCLEAELRENDIVVCTGGLGPTKDDITKETLARMSGAQGWVENQEQKEIIIRILSSRGLQILDINLKQALVPDSCQVIPNKLGTAPIMVFRFPAGRFGHPAVLYSLPGVPFEALGALPDVLEDIRTHFGLGAIVALAVLKLPEGDGGGGTLLRLRRHGVLRRQAGAVRDPRREKGFRPRKDSGTA